MIDGKPPIEGRRTDAAGSWAAIIGAALVALVATAISENSHTPKHTNRHGKARHDRYDWTHLWVLIFTFLAACAAAYEAKRLADLTDRLILDGQRTSEDQLTLTRQSNETNRDALIAAQRAWVGPIDARVDGAVETGKPVKLVISVCNTGREPARNFRWTTNSIVATSEDDSNGTLGSKIASNLLFCLGTPSLPHGQVIYPTTGFGSGFDFTTDFSEKDIDDDVVTGRKTLVIQGCVAYDSFEKTRHSGFCYFFKAGSTKIDHLNICLNGSDAD